MERPIKFHPVQLGCKTGTKHARFTLFFSSALWYVQILVQPKTYKRVFVHTLSNVRPADTTWFTTRPLFLEAMRPRRF